MWSLCLSMTKVMGMWTAMAPLASKHRTSMRWRAKVCGLPISYSAQPACSTSRPGLLTGCYPSRIGFSGAGCWRGSTKVGRLECRHRKGHWEQGHWNFTGLASALFEHTFFKVSTHWASLCETQPNAVLFVLGCVLCHVWWIIWSLRLSRNRHKCWKFCTGIWQTHLATWTFTGEARFFFQGHNQWYFAHWDMSQTGNRRFRDTFISYVYYKKKGRSRQ